MNEEEFLIGMRSGYAASESPVGLRTSDRRQHLYLIGKSGTGKTTFIRNLVIQHMRAGHGIALIDPHGDVSSELLDYVPSWRTDELVYFNATDFEFPVGLNILAANKKDAHLVTSEVLSAFKNIWRDSWGPRLEHILRNALASLLECQGVTLLDVLKLLNNDHFRSSVVRQLRDPVLKAFWTDEYDLYDERFRREAIAPIQNKIGQFVTSAPIRNILGQVQNRIDFSEVMDSGKIFIANLSKGLLGEDKSNLLGALLVTQFQLAAMRRAAQPEDERRDFFLIVDEFQNFCTDSFAGILSEARKFRLNLTLSHQFTDQLPLHIRQAVFGNVGTLVSFRVGHTDAEIMQREFGGAFASSDFVDLNRFEVLVRPIIDGETVVPFRAKTFPPLGNKHPQRENLIRCSREKYAVSRGIVEDKIRRRLRPPVDREGEVASGIMGALSANKNRHGEKSYNRRSGGQHRKRFRAGA